MKKFLTIILFVSSTWLGFAQTNFDVMKEPPKCFGEAGYITVKYTGPANLADLYYSIDGGALTNFIATQIRLQWRPSYYEITLSDGVEATSFTVEMDFPSSELLIDAEQIAVCFGEPNGKIRLNDISGGLGPYQYSFDGITWLTFTDSVTSGSIPVGNNGTVYVKDDADCEKSLIINITANADIVIDATSTATCFGSTNGKIKLNGIIGGSGAGYQYHFGDGVWQAFTVAVTSDTLTVGNNTVYVKDGAGCVKSLQINITANADIVIDAEQTTVCFGEPNGKIKLNGIIGGSGAGYQYHFGDGVWQAFTAAVTSDTLTVGNNTVYVKDGAGCEKSLIINISANADIVIDAEQTAVCFGEPNGKIKLNGIIGGSGAGYQYHFGNGVWQAFTAAVTSDTLTVGNNTVYVKDGAGCEKSLIINISANTEIIIDATSTATCFGSTNGKITLKGITGGSGAGYQYHFGDGVWQAFTAAVTSDTLTVGNNTVYVKDGAGCVKSLQINISANTEIIIDATSTATCFGSTNGKITLNGISGGSGAGYQYHFGDGNWTAFTVAVTSGDLTVGNNTVYVKDGAGCEKSLIINITANADIVIDAEQTAVCFGETNGKITLKGITGGSGAGYQYHFGNGVWQAFTAAVTSDTLTVGNNTVYVKDGAGCEKSLIINISANTEIVIDATSTATCFGSTNGKITLNNISGGTAPYEYSNDGQLSWQAFTAAAVRNNLASGNYTVWVKDANGCTESKIFTISESPELSVQLTATNILCNGQMDGKITITALGGTTPYEYSIDNGATFVPANEFNGLSAKDYTIIVKDNNECRVTDNVKIIEPVKLTFTAVISDILCSGQMDGKITITTSGGTAPYEYSIDNGQTFKPTNEFTGLAEGKYNVVIRDKNACLSDISELTIKILNPIDFNMDINDNTCKASIIVTSVTGGSGTYQYSINNGVWGAVNEFTNLSEQFYTISVKDGNNCHVSKDVELDMDYLNITPDELPEYKVNVLYNVQLGSSATKPHTFVTADKLPKGLSLTSDGKISGTPIVQPYNEFIITVKLTDANGCDTTKTYNFKGDSGLFIPNIITPNGDGKNDHFMKGHRVIIFDRLGMKLFEGNDGWDGTHKGKVVAQDTYFYILFYDGGRKTGSISTFKE